MLWQVYVWVCECVVAGVCGCDMAGVVVCMCVVAGVCLGV